MGKGERSILGGLLRIILTVRSREEKRKDIYELMVQNEFSTCKAEEGGAAMAAMADGTVCRRHTFCTARNGV